MRELDRPRFSDFIQVVLEVFYSFLYDLKDVIAIFVHILGLRCMSAVAMVIVLTVP